MEAIVLCGGKAERLGDAAGGRPKSLVEVGGQPLVAYQVGRLARAGVERVIISCASARASCSSASSRASAPRSSRRRSPSGSAAAAASSSRRASGSEDGDVYALNGDELVEVDFEALLERHRETGAAATVAVARPKSPFGVVDLGEDDVVRASRRRAASRTG